jgi:hypothetical protein
MALERHLLEKNYLANQIYTITFGTADLDVDDVLTVTHNLGVQYPLVQVIKTDGILAAGHTIVYTDTNSLTIDFSVILGEITDGTRVVVGGIGPKGDPGVSGGASFETTSKNLLAYPYTLNYTGTTLNSIVYTTDTGTITKTLNYSGDTLTSIVLSGDTPNGITLTKTLNYTGDTLTSVTYS